MVTGGAMSKEKRTKTLTSERQGCAFAFRWGRQLDPTEGVEGTSREVSLPKLVDFDWRVDVKTSSDAVARMSVPTCILNLQMEGNLEGRDSQTEWQSVNVELSKETLDTMLDGLSKIREQLASVARR